MPTGQFHRFLSTGRATINLVVDGEPVVALAGETVLTAVMVARRQLRPFEFRSEKRAGFCLMGACQDCWVQLADGERIRACSTTATEGMNIVTDAGRLPDVE